MKETSGSRKSQPGTSVGARAERDKPAEDSEVTSTICPRCAEAFAAYRNPVLVVSREWARMYEDLVEMLKGRPDIKIVIDRRRSADERDGKAGKDGWKGPERRRKKDPFSLK